MDLRGEGVLAASPERVMAYVADLSTYPQWLGIVLDATAQDDAWLVDLGARVGPFKKAKRVRMVRTVCTDVVVRFERAEADGRQHSPWVLDGRVDPEGEGTRLAMHLHYGGSKWLPGLDLVLREEVRRATGRLAALLG